MHDITIKRTTLNWLIAAACILLLFLNVNLAFLLFLILGILALSYYLEIGWYILVALSPLIHWEINFTKLGVSIFGGMRAPIVEVWAIIMLIAFAVYLLRQWWKEEKIQLHLPGLHWFLLFVLTAFISIINLAPLDREAGVKYIFHFILLFYFGYIVLSANIVKAKDMWKRSLMILAGMGFLGALMGFTSLFLGEWQGRAVPFAIAGWKPFGDQHIFLAEVITTTLPIFLYFWYITKDKTKKQIIGLITLFTAITGFLTLSRAGWLTMLVEALIFLYIIRRSPHLKNIVKQWWLKITVFLSPFVIYLVYFLFTSNLVEKSNAARWQLTDISWFLFKKHPYIGQGVGSFVDNVSQIKLFVLEFGAPIDAHGIVQKLLAEQGLLGLCAFVLFIGWILHTILRRYYNSNYTKEARLVYFVSFFLILSPLIFQMFNTQFYSSKMWVPIALAITQSILYQKDKKDIGW